MSRPKPPFEQACNQYPHRFTMEHVPAWAKHPAPGGGYYAPQYLNDREWYYKTKFPGEEGNPQVPGTHDCYSTGQTWPVGKWLAEPYEAGREPVPFLPEGTVLVSRAFLESVKLFLEGVQDRSWEPAETSERANVLEFKLDSLMRVP